MPNTVFEFKVKARVEQVAAIESAIRTAQFIRNKCIRLWMDSRGKGQHDLSAYCKVLAKDFKFAGELNSFAQHARSALARQASADRAWSSISRFYDNCKKQIPGKKGYPKFKKHSRSVEYKTTGWKLSENRKAITFTDKKGIGRLKLIGTYDLNFYQLEQIKRVRLVRRADGYYCQFIVAVDVKVEVEPTQQVVGLDVGLKEFYTDSKGHAEPNPRFYRQGEKKLKRLQRRLSRKYDKKRRAKGEKQSNNYHKARNRLARQHLKISRQRDSVAWRAAP
jgi:putative transposase